MEVLFFVEDPGAANFIEDIPPEIIRSGIETVFLATNFASKQLRTRNVDFEEIDSNSSAKNIIAKYKPKLLVVGTSQNPKSLGLDLIDYGKYKKIPSISFVDSAADSELRFCGLSNSPLKHAPDWLLVSDNHTKELFINYGYPDGNIKVIGNPSYERIPYIKKKLDKIGIQKLREQHCKNAGDNPIVIFIDEHSNIGDPRLFKSSDYTFRGRGGAKNRNEIIAGQVIDTLIDLKIKPFFVVRLHPKSNGDDYENIKGEVQKFSHDCDPYELIFCGDLIIGMTSILLMESLLLGKEVISIIPREIEKEWAPPGLLDNIDCITTSDNLRKKLNSIFVCEHKSSIQKKSTENRSIKNIQNFLLERLKVHG